jgi:sphingosine kinase
MVNYIKEICFIVNPNSGQKYSKQLLDEFITSFKIDQIDYDIIITESIEMLNKININKYKYFIFVGGDGTIFSFIQKFKNDNIIIGTIPSGTGNALSYSLLYNKYIINEKRNIIINNKLVYLNLFNAIKNNCYKKINTIDIKFLKSKKNITSFLFLSCGIFSNIDLDTEWLRFLGSFRFILGAIYELLKYIIFGNNIYAELEYVDINNNLIRIENNFAFFMANNLSHTSSTSMTSPLSKPNDGYIYLAYLTEPTTALNLLYILLGLDSGLFISNLKYIKTKWFKFNPINGKYDIDGEYYNIEPIEANININGLNVLY